MSAFFSKKQFENEPHRQLPVKKSLLFLGVIWGLVLISSLLYYFLKNSAGHSFWRILNSWLFYINIPFFCYALLSLVAERGLFNGIRYSLKQLRAFFSKHHHSQLMNEHSVNSDEELKRVLKEKYLYTSPYSELTLPLLLASGATFLLMILFALF